jgi:hypothetical protein
MKKELVLIVDDVQYMKIGMYYLNESNDKNSARFHSQFFCMRELPDEFNGKISVKRRC